MDGSMRPGGSVSAEFHIDGEQGLISVDATGRADAAELAALATELLEAPGYDPEHPLLLDLRGLRPALGRAERDRLTGQIIAGYRRRTGPVAVVIDGEMSAGLSAGIFWLACALGNAEVFDDYDHALRWLIRSVVPDRAYTKVAARG